MKKGLTQILIMLSICFGLSFGSIIANATEYPSERLYDQADLLTDEEEAKIQEQINKLQTELDWDIFAVTTNDSNGKSSMAYADDFYDERTPVDSDGLLILIDMDNRMVWISTAGQAITYISDDYIDSIIDRGYSDLKGERYYDSLRKMLGSVPTYYDYGKIDTYKELFLTILGCGFVLVVAFIIGEIYKSSVTKSYKLKNNLYQYDLKKYGSLQLTDSTDTHVDTTRSSYRIQQSSGGNGSSSRGSSRSSTHRSSSGRSHGGGGRRF